MENFESGKGGWYSTWVNATYFGYSPSPGTWAFGTPNLTLLSYAHSGVNAWGLITVENSWCWIGTGNLNSNYLDNERSQLVSPLFDFTNVQSAVISFWAWWNAEGSYDGFQVHINTGIGWKTVTTCNPNYNWKYAIAPLSKKESWNWFLTLW